MHAADAKTAAEIDLQRESNRIVLCVIFERIARPRP